MPERWPSHERCGSSSRRPSPASCGSSRRELRDHASGRRVADRVVASHRRRDRWCSRQGRRSGTRCDLPATPGGHGGARAICGRRRGSARSMLPRACGSIGCRDRLRARLRRGDGRRGALTSRKRPTRSGRPRLGMAGARRSPAACCRFSPTAVMTLLLGWTARRPPQPRGSRAGRTHAAGAVRATRGALAVLALLVAALLATPSSAGSPRPVSLVALLVATAAMSASTPPAGAPLALAALGCGATTGLVGPFLLLRLAGSGAAAARRRPGNRDRGGRDARRRSAVAPFSRPPGPSRWLALVGGAPAGRHVHLASAPTERRAACSSSCRPAWRRRSCCSRRSGRERCPRTCRHRASPRAADPEAALLGRAPEAAGVLLLSFERWVVDAIGGAVVALALRVGLGALDASTRGDHERSRVSAAGSRSSRCGSRSGWPSLPGPASAWRRPGASS